MRDIDGILYQENLFYAPEIMRIELIDRHYNNTKKIL